jgi:hypothetical protein
MKVEQVTTVDEAGSVARVLLVQVASKYPRWPAGRAMAYTVSGGGNVASIRIISVAKGQVDVGDQVEVGGWYAGRTHYVLGREPPQGHFDGRCSAREWIRCK